MDNRDTGLLLDEKAIKLHRQYFKQFLRLHGVNVQYRSPRDSSKTYNGYGELDTLYNQPIQISCIWDEHPQQKTMKMLGWNAELIDNNVLVHVPYDTPGLQAGCLLTIPSGLDNAPPRVFKVLRLSNIAIYPASVTCELGPILEDTSPKSQVIDYSKSNFNLLADPEDVED